MLLSILISNAFNFECSMYAMKNDEIIYVLEGRKELLMQME